MQFEWDENKRYQNIKIHGLDFEIAEFVFSDPNVVIEVDKRKDYGETRFLAFGKVGNLRLCLCYTMRAKKYRIITLFQVNKKGWRKHYEKDN